ncbi:C-type mannose receptor 2-like isoform X1 [Haliotis rufescens]|uniref:C-type mannose receptor 2-like isoform X1 n=2 Tax=Haliotis rufescens TaxID=6454 RepID=UPI00201EBC6B|nr:C-type mannose receptor 2-like isoform X1 [Haliotis rufescens]
MYTTLTVLVALIVQAVVDVRCDVTATPLYNGIRCLECHEVAKPSDCTMWVSCGEEEECYTREYYNRNMIRGYHMGCELKSRCDMYRRMSVLLGKRDTPTCFECCDSDDCNSALCGVGTGQSPTQNKNHRCLDCHSVADPRMCDRWSVCGVDEVCYTQASLDSTGQLRFRLGCEFQQACLVPSNQTGSDPMTCMECCESNDCNSQLCRAAVNQIASTSPVPPTDIAAMGCPQNFSKGGNSCYYFSNETKAWATALTACRGLGADLVSIETQSESDAITQILISTLQTQVTGYWIGGYYVTATSSWTWPDYQPITFTNWGPSQPRYKSYTYTITMLNPQKNSGFTVWGWASVAATTAYNYICETKAQ